MYFAVFSRDRPGASELRTRLRPAHREWLRSPGNHPIVVRLGGALLDDAGDMNGTLLVVEAETESAVRAFLAEDPYCRGDLFEHLEVRQWQWGLGQPNIETMGSK